MADEASGFAPEPTYPLAEQAEIGLLRERLYAAQNLLVKRDAEIARLTDEWAGKVLVDPEDLRRGVAFARGVGYPAPGIVDVLDRLSDAAGSAPSGHPTSPESGHAVLPGITPRTAAGEAAECDSEPQAGDRP